jgi:rod shape-determining protein MreC
MRNLFNFIARNYFFFAFLALEVVAILLIAQNHQHQRSFFLHSGNAVAGFFYRRVDAVTSYLDLQQVNEQLARENALLMEQLPPAFLDPGLQEPVIHQDSLQERRYAYLPARVINNSVIRRSNYLTIDKGSRHGIEPDMGVITPYGVVGIVKNVSERFATVISLLHHESRISVRLKEQEHIGSLIWEGGDYRRATMEYIPSHVALQRGDTILTSGFSRIFPKDVFIGTIADFEIRRGENFFTAGVDLALDFNRLGQVQVVTDLMGAEQDALEALNDN